MPVLVTPQGEDPTPLLGSSRAVEDLREGIAVFARTPFPVLVTGESGTGKTVVAQALHDRSGRRGPLVRRTRRGFNVNWMYDALHRPTQRSGDSTATVTWAYGRQGGGQTWAVAVAPFTRDTVWYAEHGNADSAVARRVHDARVHANHGPQDTVRHVRRYRHTQITRYGATTWRADSAWSAGPDMQYLTHAWRYNTTTGTLDSIRFGSRWTVIGHNNDFDATQITLPGPNHFIAFTHTTIHGASRILGGAQQATTGRYLQTDSVGRLVMQLGPDSATGTRWAYDGLGRVLRDSTGYFLTQCSDNPDYGRTCPATMIVDSIVAFAYDPVGNRTSQNGTYTTGNRITRMGDWYYQTNSDGTVRQRARTVNDTIWYRWDALGQLQSTRHKDGSGDVTVDTPYPIGDTLTPAGDTLSAIGNAPSPAPGCTIHGRGCAGPGPGCSIRGRGRFIPPLGHRPTDVPRTVGLRPRENQCHRFH